MNKLELLEVLGTKPLNNFIYPEVFSNTSSRILFEGVSIRRGLSKEGTFELKVDCLYVNDEDASDIVIVIYDKGESLVDYSNLFDPNHKWNLVYKSSIFKLRYKKTSDLFSALNIPGCDGYIKLESADLEFFKLVSQYGVNLDQFKFI